MIIYPTNLKDVLLLKPRIFEDERGCFFEPWNQKTFDNLSLPLTFVQDNVSYSKKNVLRGLHYQLPNSQGKLVSVLYGHVFDVVVDLRRSSDTFGKWQGFELSEENRLMLLMPEGFAHGFLTLSHHTIFQYKCTKHYDPNSEHTLLWNDETIGINWPLPKSTSPVISSKDSLGYTFKSCPKFK
jgi:dTDP-4-dehydrorhamnose 3,5-epimerase